MSWPPYIILSLTNFIVRRPPNKLSALQNSSGGSSEEPSPETNSQAKAIGTSPKNGEPCSDYEEISGNNTKVLGLFKWNASVYTQKYELAVFSDGNEVTSKSVTSLEAKVELERGKTYTWLVTTKNSNGETIGDTYSFTTPGVPVGNYAPYAAEIVAEFDGISSEMTISWTAKDEDGDPLLFDVRVTEEGQTIGELLESEATSLDPIPYGSGLEYWVEVISKDSAGNLSVSQWTGTAPN